jgi:branched-chain amino acid aminotransferase
MANLSSLAHVDDNPSWIWRNGVFMPWDQAGIHVNAVGHASTSAVFEGIKAYRSQDGGRLLVFRLDEHLARLYRSARICRLHIPFDVDQLRDAILELLRINGYRDDVYIRPWIFPEGVIREQIVPAGVRCEVVIDTWPFRSGLTGRRGCRAAVSSWLRPSDTSVPARIKAFSNYHNSRLAVLEAKANGHDFPILLNDRHKVSEGPSACIALVNRELVTPSLTSDVLGSITRATVSSVARGLGTPMAERDVDRTELYLADELFFMGTGVEILPITSIDGLTVGDGEPGPVTLRIRDAYANLVRGAADPPAAWLTEISLGDGVRHIPINGS